MSNYSCELCDNGIPREGMRVCDTCLGLNTSASLKDTSASKEPKPAPTESTPNLCNACGAPIEPYKIGSQTRRQDECRDCYYKRRFGTDWKPGGQTKEEKAAKCKAWRETRRSKQMKESNDNGNSDTTTTLSDTGPPEVHTEHVATLDSIKAGQQEQAIMAKTISGALAVKGIKHLTIAFADDDEAMYERLKAIATKERRSMEQQVLYFLDRVVEV